MSKPAQNQDITSIHTSKQNPLNSTQNITLQLNKSTPQKTNNKDTITIPSQVYDWLTTIAERQHQELDVTVDNIIDHCLNNGSFNRFLAPFLPVITTNNTTQNLAINCLQNINQLIVFCQSLEASPKKVLILMICFILSRDESTKSPSQREAKSKLPTIKIPSAEYTALKQVAQSKGLSMINLLAEMLVFADENPETHYPLLESIIYSRRNLTVSKDDVYIPLQDLSRALDTPVIDTASGLISYCLSNEDFMASIPESPKFTLRITRSLAKLFTARAMELGLTFDAFVRDLLVISRIDIELYPPTSSAKTAVEISESTMEYLQRFKDRNDPWSIDSTLSAILDHWRLKMSL